MEAMIGHQTDSIINRFEDLTTGLGAVAIRMARHASLTSRDIEAELLVRLGRKGYDWSGALGRRRRAP